MYLTYTKDGWVPRLDRELAFRFPTHDEAEAVAKLLQAFRPQNIHGPLVYAVELV